MYKLQDFLVDNRNILLSILGAILFFVPVFFLEYLIPSGICCVLGLSLLLFMWKIAKTKGEFITTTLLFYGAHLFRYVHLLEKNILNILLIAVIFIPYTLIMFGAVILERRIIRTRYLFLGVFITPIAYGLTCYLCAITCFGYIFDTMAYLMIIPCYISSLSNFTEYGMTAFFMLIISFVSYIFILRPAKSKAYCGVFATLLAVIPIIAGTIQLKSFSELEPDFVLNVALGVPAKMSFFGDGEVLPYEERIEMLDNELAKAKEGKADLFVTSEEFLYCTYDDEPQLLNDVSNIIAKYDIPALIGFMVIDADYVDYDTNCVRYYNGDGEEQLCYKKHSLVPFVETGDVMKGDEKPGYIKTNIGGHDINLSAIICFDINNENYVRTVEDDTELLLCPSWDWFNGNVEQIRTWIRSKTVNTTLLKHSFEGFSHVSTPDGRMVELVDTREQYKQVFFVDTPIYKK